MSLKFRSGDSHFFIHNYESNNKPKKITPVSNKQYSVIKGNLER